ncbi:hypothetical protein [Planomicrobium okeanokoites]|uniref:hypothetical protein n=1 Tax=Planomicrobium okeanokoites TaxID=244 RepID=UPI000A073B74|nr:hypothetical protein [Planomicrobium okeanokoites]
MRAAIFISLVENANEMKAWSVGNISMEVGNKQESFENETAEGSISLGRRLIFAINIDSLAAISQLGIKQSKLGINGPKSGIKHKKLGINRTELGINQKGAKNENKKSKVGGCKRNRTCACG